MSDKQIHCHSLLKKLGIRWQLGLSCNRLWPVWSSGSPNLIGIRITAGFLWHLENAGRGWEGFIFCGLCFPPWIRLASFWAPQWRWLCKGKIYAGPRIPGISNPVQVFWWSRQSWWRQGTADCFTLSMPTCWSHQYRMNCCMTSDWLWLLPSSLLPSPWSSPRFRNSNFSRILAPTFTRRYSAFRRGSAHLPGSWSVGCSGKYSWWKDLKP